MPTSQTKWTASPRWRLSNFMVEICTPLLIKINLHFSKINSFSSQKRLINVIYHNSYVQWTIMPCWGTFSSALVVVEYVNVLESLCTIAHHQHPPHANPDRSLNEDGRWLPICLSVCLSVGLCQFPSDLQLFRYTCKGSNCRDGDGWNWSLKEGRLLWYFKEEVFDPKKF